MTTFDVMNLPKILTNHRDKSVSQYFYKHKTTGANMFRCSCCDFETKLFREEEMKNHTTLIKQSAGIKRHILSYDHRYNEYYGKGLIPIIPDFDGDLINNTFDFFKDHISTNPDEDGLVWCDLCQVSFKTRKQLYTHLVKTNKKHLVKQVEKEQNVPFKINTDDAVFDVEYLTDNTPGYKTIISPENRVIMEKYKNDDEYCCKYCFNYNTMDDIAFYNHLRSKTHKTNKILDEHRDTYNVKKELGIFCNKCKCDVESLVEHHKLH